MTIKEEWLKLEQGHTILSCCWIMGALLVSVIMNMGNVITMVQQWAQISLRPLLFLTCDYQLDQVEDWDQLGQSEQLEGIHK